MSIVLLVLAVIACFAVLWMALGGDPSDVSPPALFREAKRTVRDLRAATSGKRTAHGGPLVGALLGDVRGYAGAHIKPGVGEFWRETFVSGGTSTPGEKFVSFQDLPREIHGRPVHMLGVLLTVTLDYTSVALTMGTVMREALVRSLLSNFRLKVGDHHYIDGSADFDGWDLEQACFLRGAPSSRFGPDPEIPDADETNEPVTIYAWIPFSRPKASGSRRYDYAIAAANFADPGRDNGLRFNVSLTPRRGAFAGVTFNSVTSIRADVHLAALDDLRVTAWKWGIYQVNEAQFELPAVGSLEALAITDDDTTTAYQSKIANLSLMTLRIGGQSLYERFTLTQLAQQAVGVGNDPDITVQSSVGTNLPLLTTPKDGNRTKFHRGKLRFEYTGTVTNFRYLVMDAGLRMDLPNEALKRQLGAPPDASDPMRSGAVEKAATDGGKVTTKAAPALDGKVYWATMPYPVTRRKLWPGS